MAEIGDVGLYTRAVGGQVPAVVVKDYGDGTADVMLLPSSVVVQGVVLADTAKWNGKPAPPATPEWSRVKLAADYSNNTTTVTDVGLGFTPSANTSYEFRGRLWLRTALATTSPRVGVQGPSGATVDEMSARIRVPSSATAENTLNLGAFANTVTAGTAGLPSILTSFLATLEGCVKFGASAGTGQVRVIAASEIAASSITVRAGSFLEWRAIT